MRALYFPVDTARTAGLVDDERLAAVKERHRLALSVVAASDAATAMVDGVIVEAREGWVPRERLELIRRELGRRRRVWVYWPNEQTIESIDAEGLRSLQHLWLFSVAHVKLARALALPRRMRVRAARAIVPGDLAVVPKGMARSVNERLDELDRLIAEAAPVPFASMSRAPSASAQIRGLGAYLRTDYWARIDSGGSYGHTCYVAKELAAVTQDFAAFMAHRYRLLDDLGVRQIVLDSPGESAAEDEIVTATAHYLRVLRPAFELARPAYIYERLVLGNYAGALLSKALQIPYIVEYNGSEISMRRSFDGVGYRYEQEYMRMEMLAFKQATMISVVSEEVRKSLIARDVDARKILTNPNGADLMAYAPAVPGEKARIRRELGLPDDAPVIGFTGTFGGWHGVDVLAAAIPRICEQMPFARFLLIGDGNYKHLVDDAVAKHHLEARVLRPGRVPQAQGARMLKACDIYVSPHNSHMVDSRFFGSPTKVFEYMAMGGAIVASDLEQIGESLSPALRLPALRQERVAVSDERAVLCTPGDVQEFTEAVVAVAERPELWATLGRNARAAIERHYSWQRHVERLWEFICAQRTTVVAGPRSPQVVTGDSFKDEVQRQWDNDPAGSHYVTAAQSHTLEWFLEAEAYRYGEYAPWMRETMEFDRHQGERVLEIGGGMGTDLAQFAAAGAIVTDLDLSSGHLELARESFRLRRLQGEFILHDAESLPFDDATFDLVYSNGVIHHTPNTSLVIEEIRRVLKPGGRTIIMVYAENSLHYWRNLVWAIGIKEGQLQQHSMGDIMSRVVERSDNAAARPLVKVYTRKRLKSLFEGFEDISIVQRQMVQAEVPRLLARVPVERLGKIMGWNLIIKARKPRR